MDHPTPDRALRRQLLAIDRGLRFEFLDPPERWAVLHLEQVDDRLDAMIDRTAREVQAEALRMGYVLDLADCAWMACQAVKDRTVVFYCVEENGDYRAPDGRDIAKLQRMDHYRRNLGLRDWQALVRAKADLLREQRLRSEEDVWQSIRRDPVFARVLSDILWSGRATRSIIVPANITNGHKGGASSGDSDQLHE